MIYGIGTDVCDIRRIRATLERKGERFAQKVLGPTEWWVYQYRKGKHAARGEAYLATRFSAKEAFSKAIGLGIHHPMTWRDCEILNQPSGQPFVRLHGELATWFAQRRLHAHMTVSDETEYVATFCVVERWPEGQPLPPEPVDRVALALARQAEAAAAALGSASGAGSGAADA